jgi:predicted nucleotidyltransferase
LLRYTFLILWFRLLFVKINIFDFKSLYYNGIKAKRDIGLDKMIELVEKQRGRLDELCRGYRVKRLELFGSAIDPARFEEGTSDLDFIVEFQQMSPGEHAKAYLALLGQLQDLFGRNIDLIEIKAVANPYLLESINETRSPIYAS